MRTMVAKYRILGTLTAVLALLVAACGEPQAVEAPDTEGAPDVVEPEGTEAAAPEAEAVAPTATEVTEVPAPEGGLAIWSRAGDVGEFTQYLVEQWNATHDGQIAVTIIPNDQYITKVSTAAAAGELPDLLGVDLIYMPDFNSAGLMVDITDRVEALEFADALAPAHMEMGEWEGAYYSVPLSIDTSSLVYNKDLFEQAGLDPESPPTTFAEIEEYAKAVDALGDDYHGFYIAGACPGCNVFTLTPTIWAQDGDVLTEDGDANFDSPEVERTLSFFRNLWEQDLMPPAAQGGDGGTWLATFMNGDIGMQFCGSFCPSAIEAEAPDLNAGFGFIPGPDGGRSSFAGGDVVGITSDTQNVELAWDFIDWMLSEEVQLEHFAAQGKLVARTDLADNEHADEVTRLHNEATEIGQTPKTLGFFEVFNSPTGPWLTMLQTAIFEGDIERAMSEGQATAQNIIELAQ